MKRFDATYRLASSSSLALMLLVARLAQAQVAAGPPAQGAVTSQLPLSGESPQGGAVIVGQASVPGTTVSVNTLNVTTQTLGPFSGSVNGSARRPLSGALGIADAINRGLDFNLGAEGIAQAIRQSQGQATIARSELLPHIGATASETRLKINLAVVGLQANTFGGIPIPTVVGPYNYFDLRAHVAQTVLDVTAWRNYQSATEIVRADEHVMKTPAISSSSRLAPPTSRCPPPRNGSQRNRPNSIRRPPSFSRPRSNTTQGCWRRLTSTGVGFRCSPSVSGWRPFETTWR